MITVLFIEWEWHSTVSRSHAAVLQENYIKGNFSHVFKQEDGNPDYWQVREKDCRTKKARTVLASPQRRRKG